MFKNSAFRLRLEHSVILFVYAYFICPLLKTQKYYLHQFHSFPDSADALPADVLDTLRCVRLLDKLTGLRCYHALHANDRWEDSYSDRKFDTYRGEVHKTLIVSFAEPGATPRKLETLDIVNLPCRSQPDLTNRQSFSDLLKTLKTFSLRFDHYPAYHEPYVISPLGGVSHEFFTRFPRAWLAPAAPNLTCLALSALELWGYLLKVDFRGVHFPKLETLVMNNFVFSHDWQLDWILSHNSLQEMRLMQCRILTHAIWFGEKDDEGYPTRFSRSDTLHLRYHHYAKAWHHYYQRFLSLDNLTYFTTKADDRSVVADLTGMYEGFDEGSWLEEIPEPDRQAEDKRMLKYLRSKAHDRLKAKLKAKSKAKSRSGH